MYTFSNRLKIASFILMAVGFLGIVGGFFMAPGTIEEAKEMVAHHGGDHAAEDVGMGAEVAHGNAWRARTTALHMTNMYSTNYRISPGRIICCRFFLYDDFFGGIGVLRDTKGRTGGLVPLIV